MEFPRVQVFSCVQRKHTECTVYTDTTGGLMVVRIEHVFMDLAFMYKIIGGHDAILLRNCGTDRKFCTFRPRIFIPKNISRVNKMAMFDKDKVKDSVCDWARSFIYVSNKYRLDTEVFYLRENDPRYKRRSHRHYPPNAKVI